MYLNLFSINVYKNIFKFAISKENYKMSKLTKFDYEGNNITFVFTDGNKMVNATEMAKPFGKPVGNFLRLAETKRYIDVLQKRYSHLNIAQNREVLRVIKGGDTTEGQQGTWMDEKLALKFAAWLAPEFELWVYDRIFELLTTGKTEIKEHRPAYGIVKSLRMIADQIENHDREITEIKEDIIHIKDYVSDLEAKITSIDEQYYTVSGYCALNHIDCPLDKARKWGYNATKLSNQKGVDVGKAYDAKYGEINAYHINILKEIIK